MDVLARGRLARSFNQVSGNLPSFPHVKCRGAFDPSFVTRIQRMLWRVSLRDSDGSLSQKGTLVLIESWPNPKHEVADAVEFAEWGEGGYARPAEQFQSNGQARAPLEVLRTSLLAIAIMEVL